MGAFGDLIKTLQTERGWSFSRFSKEADISVTRLQDILKMDEPQIHGSTLEKLAKSFEMTVADLRKAYEAKKALVEKAESMWQNHWRGLDPGSLAKMAATAERMGSSLPGLLTMMTQQSLLYAIDDVRRANAGESVDLTSYGKATLAAARELIELHDPDLLGRPIRSNPQDPKMLEQLYGTGEIDPEHLDLLIWQVSTCLDLLMAMKRGQRIPLKSEMFLLQGAAERALYALDLPPKSQAIPYLSAGWSRAADHFGIPAEERASFAAGKEGEGLWDWLKLKGQLHRLWEVFPRPAGEPSAPRTNDR